MEQHTKHLLDGAALLGAIATFVGWLPAIAATLSIIWTAIRIWETKTVQGLVARWRK